LKADKNANECHLNNLLILNDVGSVSKVFFNRKAREVSAKVAKIEAHVYKNLACIAPASRS
jgi:hypothetical protein